MKLKIILSLFSIAMTMQSIANPPVEEAKAIFTTRCASCHTINKMIVGPALAGVDQRRSMDWIIKFVQSSQTVIKNGDKDATTLFAKFNNIPMPDHKDLSAENIKGIVEYIKSQSTTTAGAAEKAPFSRPSKIRPAYVPVSLSNYGFFIGYFLAVVVLIVTLLFFVGVKEYQRNGVKES